MTPERRALLFDRLDQVMPDVDRLLDGHRAVGNWSLGQVCSHLTRSVVASVEGFPGTLPWVLRATLGRRVWRGMRTTGRIREGVWLPEAARPKPDLDARAEAEAMRAALRLFATHTGPFGVHPLIGSMTRDDWDLFHRIHCAHHLSFVLPAVPVG